MRRRTLVAIVVLVVALGAVVVGGIVSTDSSDGELRVMWVSDTARDSNGNHHAPAVAESLVYAPISGASGTDQCGLVALDASTGGVTWQDPIPPDNCTIHSIADPTVADFDDDGTEEVLAATTEERLVAYDPGSGDVEFTYELSSYGYTQPVVADILGDDSPETVVVDVTGTIFVIRADGTTAWTRQTESYTWGQPAVADFDGDGQPEVAVGGARSSGLSLFEHDGTPAWETPVAFEGSITWMTTGETNVTAGPGVVVATTAGTVAMVDGDGRVVWDRDLGSFAAVDAMVDGDDDGSKEVYAVAKDGTLSSLDAETGETEWETTLTTETVQMMPPPAAGDIDGDGSAELVAPAHDGSVSVVDPVTGDVSARYERAGVIYTHPALADVDGDGDAEAFVTYGRGRVVGLDFAA